MRITYNSVNYDFKNPLFGYRTIIDLGIKWQFYQGNKFIPWDDGIAYTTRKCFCTLALDKTEFNTLIELFRFTGRNQNIELIPGAGFHPYGADRGDTPTFKSRLLNIKQNSSIGHPQDTFLADCEFIFNDPSGFPAYTPPSSGGDGQKYQGVLQIGTIEDLRYPPDMAVVDIKYAINTITTTDGTPYGNDLTANSDSYESTLNLIQNESKTAELIDHLVNTVRSNQVLVIPPANSYMFGRENGSTASYYCRMIQNQIEIINNRYNEFSFTLKFWLESVGE